MNKRSSDIQALNDRALYFTDQLCADEVTQLLNNSAQFSETLANDSCSSWRSVFDSPVSKTTRNS